MMHTSRRHWTAAFSAALLVHAGVVVAALWEPPNPSAAGGGAAGIAVSLSPAGGAPNSAAAPAPEAPPPLEATPTEPDDAPPAPVTPVETEMTAPLETPVETVPDETAEVREETDVPPPEPMEDPAVVEETEPVITDAETTPEEAPEPVDVETVIEMAEIPPIDETVPIVEPVPPPEEVQDEPITETTEAPPEEVAVAQTIPVPPPPRRRPTPPPVPVTERRPVPQPVPEPVQEVASAAVAAEEPLAAVDSPLSDAAGIANAPADAAEPAEQVTGGLSGASLSYMAVLQAWLERHKEYPRRAQLRRQEGTALLYFVIDRTGRVLEARLQQSSGHDLLDRAVMAMIERAQPLPSMPDEMRQARLELVVPIEFFLR